MESEFAPILITHVSPTRPDTRDDSSNRKSCDGKLLSAQPIPKTEAAVRSVRVPHDDRLNIYWTREGPGANSARGEGGE